MNMSARLREPKVMETALFLSRFVEGGRAFCLPCARRKKCAD
jgi:hypothetical protein